MHVLPPREAPEAVSCMARTSVASEPRDRSAPSPAAHKSACRGVRGAKPLGKTSSWQRRAKRSISAISSSTSRPTSCAATDARFVSSAIRWTCSSCSSNGGTTSCRGPRSSSSSGARTSSSTSRRASTRRSGRSGRRCAIRLRRRPLSRRCRAGAIGSSPRSRWWESQRMSLRRRWLHHRLWRARLNRR